MIAQDSAAQTLDVSVSALFADAPVLDDVELLFDDAVSRAANDIDDAEAFAIITKSFEVVKRSGELDRLERMSMSLGGAACMHNHLEQVADTIQKTHLPNAFDAAVKERQQVEAEQKKKKAKKRKRRIWSWYMMKFVEVEK